MRLEGGRDVSVLSRIVKYSKSPASAKCPTKRIYFQKLLHFIPSYLRLLKILVTKRITYVTKVCADKFRWKDICEWVPLSSTHPSVQHKKASIQHTRQFNIWQTDKNRYCSPQFDTPSVQHISSTQKDHSFLAPKSLSSTPKTPQFNTTPSVPLQKPLSSTHLTQIHGKNPWVSLP